VQFNKIRAGARKVVQWILFAWKVLHSKIPQISELAPVVSSANGVFGPVKRSCAYRQTNSARYIEISGGFG